MARPTTKRNPPLKKPAYEFSDEYVSVENMTIPNLTASRSIDKVKAAIEQRYGFTPPDNYVSDLIEFVIALTDGQ